jgi:hypothetical protein
LRQPELAIKLFVQHIRQFPVGGCHTAFHREGKPLVAWHAGTKNPAPTHEGVKAGLELRNKLVFSPIRSLARPLPPHQCAKDLMSVNEQVF